MPLLIVVRCDPASACKRIFRGAIGEKVDIDSEQGNRPARDAPTSTTWPATGLRKIFTFFSPIGREETFRNGNSTVKVSEALSRSYRTESEIDSEQGNRLARDTPTSTTWPATGLRKIFTFFSIGPVLFDHNQRDALSLSSFRYLSAARPTWQVQFSDNQSPIHNLSPVRLWAALSSLRISLQPSQNDHKASKGGRSSTSS